MTVLPGSTRADYNISLQVLQTPETGSAGSTEPPSRQPLAVGRPPLLVPALPRGAQADRRWSLDGWLLWRKDSAAAAAPGVTAYGRSQAGAVLRYRLFPASPLRPALYLRASSALQAPRQPEAAAGLAFRPLAAVPVQLAAEARLTDTDTGLVLRPAAFAVTEFPRVLLPHGLRGEAYLQAGYVGGRYETAFVDGQARVDRRLATVGSGNALALGFAVWGGAQRGTERLDVGPSATIEVPLGTVSSRLAVDYRFRVAGDAAPASGPALTLSAGF